ncbi:MAG: helix-turn-helix domain-containing protein [Candidatus Methanofastidiosia archaeon]
MTEEEEDLRREVAQLRKEIEELKTEKKNEEEERIMKALQWLNLGEAKAKAYIYLVKKGKATAEDVAEGAQLYPTTAREVLNSLSAKGIVKRAKLETDGAGRKPFVYTAILPSELLRRQVHHIEQTLSELLQLEFIKKEGEIQFKAPLLPIRIEIKRVRGKKDHQPQE